MSRRVPLLALAVGALMLTAVVVIARAMPPIVTSSDLGITELYTELATRGELLVGPDSRFAWNHPGPMYFYLLAPLYAASGHHAGALFTGAVAINLAAIFVLVWAVSRDERGPLLALVAIACLAFAWKVPRLMASPWTAHIPVLASLAFVVVCGTVIGGRHRLLPLLILLGCFISQTHLSYVPVVGVLCSVAVVSVLLQLRRSAAPVVGVSAIVGLVCWLPTLIEAFMNRGGNIAALWRFFVANGSAAHSVSESFAAWSQALTTILGPNLALPWGGHFVAEPSVWRLPLAAAQVLGLWLVSWWSIRRQRRVESGIAACAALASMVGFWSITRIHGEILDHELFGLVALGTLNLAILSAGALRPVWPAKGRGRDHAAVVTCVTALMACAFVGVQHLNVFTSFEIRRSDTVRIPATYESLRVFFDQRGIHRPLFQMDGDAASDGTGVVLRFLQAGWPFAVEEQGTSVFGGMFAKTGQEDALVNFSSREGIHLGIAARPGNVVIRDRHPLFVDVVPIPRSQPRPRGR